MSCFCWEPGRIEIAWTHHHTHLGGRNRTDAEYKSASVLCGQWEEAFVNCNNNGQANMDLIRLGDATHHGGKVISASPAMDCDGLRLARKGDGSDMPEASRCTPESYHRRGLIDDRRRWHTARASRRSGDVRMSTDFKPELIFDLAPVSRIP